MEIEELKEYSFMKLADNSIFAMTPDSQNVLRNFLPPEIQKDFTKSKTFLQELFAGRLLNGEFRANVSFYGEDATPTFQF
jgi:hypothetical protein